MWAQVLLLCAVGALYPVALAAVTAYLGGDQPMRQALGFLAGGAVISAITGVALLVVFRNFGLTPHQHRTPSAVIDIGLGLGIVGWAVAALLHDHGRARPKDGGNAESNSGDGTELVPPRRVGDRSLIRPFLAGVAIYLPMLNYFAAMKLIADQPISPLQSAVVLIPCIAVSLLITELPIVVVAVARERSAPILDTASGLVRRYSRPVLLIAAAGIGALFIGKGIAQL